MFNTSTSNNVRYGAADKMSVPLKEVTVTAWIADYDKTVRYIEVNNCPRPHYNVTQKASSSIIYSICCIPCCAWSTIWRVIACPFQCACHGPGYMCSDNSCTHPTDSCMTTTYDTITATHKLNYLPDLMTITAPERNMLLTKINEIRTKFTANNYKDSLYYLYDAVSLSLRRASNFTGVSTPSQIVHMTNTIISKLSV